MISFNYLARGILSKLVNVSFDIGCHILASLPGQQTNGGLNLFEAIKCCLANLHVNNGQHGFAFAHKLVWLISGCEIQVYRFGPVIGFLFVDQKFLQ